MIPQDNSDVGAPRASSERDASTSAFLQTPQPDLRTPPDSSTERPGPNTLPALRDLCQVPDDVPLPTTVQQPHAAAAFISSLNAIDVPEAARELPELDALRAAHPADIEAHRELARGCAHTRFLAHGTL